MISGLLFIVSCAAMVFLEHNDAGRGLTMNSRPEIIASRRNRQRTRLSKPEIEFGRAIWIMWVGDGMCKRIRRIGNAGHARGNSGLAGC